MEDKEIYNFWSKEIIRKKEGFIRDKGNSNPFKTEELVKYLCNNGKYLQTVSTPIIDSVLRKMTKHFHYDNSTQEYSFL